MWGFLGVGWKGLDMGRQGRIHKDLPPLHIFSLPLLSLSAIILPPFHLLHPLPTPSICKSSPSPVSTITFQNLPWAHTLVQPLPPCFVCLKGPKLKCYLYHIDIHHDMTSLLQLALHFTPSFQISLISNICRPWPNYSNPDNNCDVLIQFTYNVAFAFIMTIYTYNIGQPMS